MCQYSSCVVIVRYFIISVMQYGTNPRTVNAMNVRFSPVNRKARPESTYQDYILQAHQTKSTESVISTHYFDQPKVNKDGTACICVKTRLTWTKIYALLLQVTTIFPCWLHCESSCAIHMNALHTHPSIFYKQISCKQIWSGVRGPWSLESKLQTLAQSDHLCPKVHTSIRDCTAA